MGELQTSLRQHESIRHHASSGQSNKTARKHVERLTQSVVLFVAFARQLEIWQLRLAVVIWQSKLSGAAS
jgi:hypothetical protein